MWSTAPEMSRGALCHPEASYQGRREVLGSEAGPL